MNPLFTHQRTGVAGQLNDTAVAPALAPAIAPAQPDGTAVATGDGPDTSDPIYRAKATEAAVKFESFFIGQMMHQMRSTTREIASEDSAFHDPVNSDMLDIADNLVADRMAGQHAFGIADAILRQLLPPAPPPPSPANAMPGTVLPTLLPTVKGT